MAHFFVVRHKIILNVLRVRLVVFCMSPLQGQYTLSLLFRYRYKASWQGLAEAKRFLTSNCTHLRTPYPLHGEFCNIFIS